MVENRCGAANPCVDADLDGDAVLAGVVGGGGGGGAGNGEMGWRWPMGN